MKPTIIFDYDGTLHETMRIYAPAVFDTVRWLKEDCRISVEEPSKARIQSWLGMNTSDMWNSFLPELAPELKKTAAARIGGGMLLRLQEGYAAWYDGAKEALDALVASDMEMAILSNCGNSYARAQWDAFGMERWFTAFFPCEAWNHAPKDEILPDIARDYEAAFARTPVRRGAPPEKESPIEERSFLVVGDRDSDLAAARSIGAPFIGCAYGYGSKEELTGADLQIRSIRDLPDAVREIFS